jgi:hypothetical protein
MNLRTTTGVLIGTVLAAALAAAPRAPQGEGGATLQGQQLNNCDIDIRPVDAGEAQVYFASQAKGASFDVFVTMNDVLEVGNYDATQTRKLKAGAANRVSWVYDTSTNKVTLTIRNNVDADLVVESRFEGRYDPLGPLGEPVVEEVRGPAANKRRLRVSLRNFGVTVGWTITDL